MKHFYLFCLLCFGFMAPTAMGQGQYNLGSKNTKIIIPVAANGSLYKNFQNQNIAEQNVVEQLNEWFLIGEDHSFVQVATKSDDLGFTHTTFKHLYKNVVVDGSGVIAHFKNGV